MGNGQSTSAGGGDAAATLAAQVLRGEPSSIALVKGGDREKSVSASRVTRGDLHRLCVEFANVLRNNGVRPGDVVTIAEANTLEQVVVFLGCTYARAVAAPLNQNYTTDEFKYYMKDANSKLLVTGANGNKAAEAAGVVPSMTVAVAVGGGAGAGAAPTLSVTSSKTMNVSKQKDFFASDPPRPDDVALFLHTSGTTSRPKGVPLSHANLVASLRNIKGTYEFSPSDVSLLVMPLFHVHGLMAGLLSPLLSGASVVLPEAGRFSAGTFWQDAVEHKVTFYTAVPTMHQILVSRADKDYPSKNPPPIRVIRSCSSSLAPATLFQVEKLFKAPVLEAYAMTEASHQMTSNPLPKFGERKPGTVGKPQGSVKVAILDDACKMLGPGQVGEVCIQGPNVTKGYKNNPKANKEAFAGGWFHTGDQGYLSEDGYLSLTGRIKELINRGGEKISPLEVDATLLAHPDVGEAVSFAAPDDKYGEEVAAAVVLKSDKELKSKGEEAVVASIKDFCKGKISDFKIPKQIFITDTLPKNATGKIQRRFMVDAFINKKKDDTSAATKGTAATSASASAPPAAPPTAPTAPGASGYDLAARALADLGIKHMFGVIGIPVTQMASAAQAAGIRFISCRNEQAAGYAAAAAGFLTGKPGVLLTVSGPGMVHGIAGLSHAKVNGWPMIMISGSCETNEVGKGAFQELDQCEAASAYVKLSVRARRPDDIAACIRQAYDASMSGGLGASYVDVPSDVFMSAASAAKNDGQRGGAAPRSRAKSPSIATLVSRSKIAEDVQAAKRPLVVLGVGAAAERAEGPLRELVAAWNVPFITASMARGVVPDSDENCVNAARSMALANADVVLVFGSPLNWQLHFGQPPKWSSDATFILIDSSISKRDRSMAKKCLEAPIGDAAAALAAAGSGVSSAAFLTNPSWGAWRDQLRSKVNASKEKLEGKLSSTAFPLNYLTTLRVIRDAINAEPLAPVVVAEGANTMDQARILLEPVEDPRCRMDAGAWGTMGIGMGCAIAAAVTTDRAVIAIEGDSAFGFSGMEVETICRYELPITVVVFNNGGIYGGDRRPGELRERAAAGLERAGFATDPPPTAFVPEARYDMLATAFGGDGYNVSTAAQLEAALQTSLKARRPALINVAIDPSAGVESGTVHGFNFKK